MKPTTTLAALLLATAASGASAAPCAGFADVDSASAFCPSVEWVRNRGVTLGCGGGVYCPNDAVTRLSMAAFLNRLGTALTPVQLRFDAATGAIDLDANPVVCQTVDQPIAGFPRRVVVDLAFAATAAFDTNVAADLVKSTNGGASWTTLNVVGNLGAVPANRWGTLSSVAVTDVDVGQNVRFGVRVSRGGLPGATDLGDSRCQLRASIYSRDGIVSPL
jgi:hypothetical protein